MAAGVRLPAPDSPRRLRRLRARSAFAGLNGPAAIDTYPQFP